jgi:hypothetical protein
VGKALRKEKGVRLQKALKKQKQREALNAITDKTVSAVVDRYLQFVKDQFTYHHLVWKKRFNDSGFTEDQLNTVRLRNALEYKDPIKLFNERDQQPIDVEYAEFEARDQLVDVLPPCLDPDVADHKRTTDEMLAQRTVDSPQIQILKQEDVSIEEMLDNRPAQLIFFPSAEK